MNLPNITDNRFFKYRYHLGYSLVVILAILTLGYRLNNIYGSGVANRFEKVSSTKLSDLFGNSVNLPFNVLHTLINSYLGQNSLASLRMTSIVFGLITVVAVYSTTRRLHSERAGLLSALAILSSAWFLPIARNGGQLITIPAALAIVWSAYSYLYLQRRTHVGLLIAVVALAFASYLPLGLVWIILGIFMAPKAILHELIKPMKNHYLMLSAGIYALLLSGLIWTFIRSPLMTIRNIVVWPNQMPGLKEFVQRLIDVPLSFVWRSQPIWETHLGRQTLLDIVSLTLATLGALYIFKNWRLKRIRFVIGSTIIALIFYGLTGKPELMSLFIPVTYISIGMGASRLYRGWTDMFPRNNLARYIAVLPLTLVILMGVFYNLKYVFAVMPQTPEVLKSYGKIDSNT
jgi:hypothetical protein